MAVRRPVRVLVALVLTAAAALTLAGCRVQTGAAAFVGDSRISESTVETYVGTTVPATETGQLPPRAQVVNILVATDVLRSYLDASGDVPSQASLAADRSAAFVAITGGAAPEQASLRDAVEKSGFSAGFADLYVNFVDLEYAAFVRTNKPTSAEQFYGPISAASPKVRVSPRYGSWDASKLSLSGATEVPGYLQLSAAPAATTGA